MHDKVNKYNAPPCKSTCMHSFMHTSIKSTFAYQQINNNGPLSFGQKFTDHVPKSFPLSASMATLIAPFWDDIDNRVINGGNISYRLTQNPDDIQRAREDVSRAKFAEVDDFIPTYLLIATWYQVSHYNQPVQQVN